MGLGLCSGGRDGVDLLTPSASNLLFYILSSKYIPGKVCMSSLLFCKICMVCVV